MNPAIKHLQTMRRSPLANYIVPGLVSSLLGGEGMGTVRLFEATREQLSDIVPHSHRFAFACQVVRGVVTNRIWSKAGDGDLFQQSTLAYGGEPGKYDACVGPVERWSYADTEYAAGDWYGMTADEVHSIKFSKDAVVLFFEGPQESDSTIILEPVVNKKRIPTFKVEPWMFEKMAP